MSDPGMMETDGVRYEMNIHETTEQTKTKDVPDIEEEIQWHIQELHRLSNLKWS